MIRTATIASTAYPSCTWRGSSPSLVNQAPTTQMTSDQCRTRTRRSQTLISCITVGSALRRQNVLQRHGMEIGLDLTAVLVDPVDFPTAAVGLHAADLAPASLHQMFGDRVLRLPARLRTGFAGRKAGCRTLARHHKDQSGNGGHNKRPHHRVLPRRFAASPYGPSLIDWD